ncbi:hypothetical protein DY000_02017836 [Brassica cretica]|uniref:Uncharacterized protein n=1 Tax=Brassica cretica TaxID=69181 RepID=A0ABQ7CV01_BRACR|nr:hypothetical protein DY000_02017836 [Brassica cretica]
MLESKCRFLDCLRSSINASAFSLARLLLVCDRATTGGITPSRATMVRYTTHSSQSCNSIDTLISFCLNLHYLHKHRNSSFLHHRRLRFRRRHQQIHNKSRSRFCCLRSAITGGGAHAAFSLAVGVPDFNALTSGLIAPARRSNQLLVLVAEGEIQDGGYSVLLEVRIGGSDLMAPALAILIRFSGLFSERSMLASARRWNMRKSRDVIRDIGSNRRNSQRRRRGRVVGSRRKLLEPRRICR